MLEVRTLQPGTRQIRIAELRSYFLLRSGSLPA
jgi:hypothetical protein